MSQENVDLFKESMERFNSGDVAGALRYMHPDTARCKRSTESIRVSGR